jgi:hypothetical protein
MSALAIVALVLVSAWLGVLTFVVMLLVRQVGLLTVRLSMATQAMSLDDDGPEIGGSLPEDVAEVMPEGERAYLLLISAGCDPCRELVAELDGHRFEQKVVALVPGRQEQVAELVALLPPDIRVVLDPEATSPSRHSREALTRSTLSRVPTCIGTRRAGTGKVRLQSTRSRRRWPASLRALPSASWGSPAPGDPPRGGKYPRGRGHRRRQPRALRPPHATPAV